MGIVEELKKEYTIEDEWFGLEIHPETPIQGVNLNNRFGASNLKSMKESLIFSGKEYGIEFGNLNFMPNSHSALESAEYARSVGKFEAYHKALMDAYFKDGRDIGKIDVLIELARKIDMDDKELYDAIKERRFETKLISDANRAHGMGINSTPVFIINDEYMIIGAQHIDIFRETLDSIGE